MENFTSSLARQLAASLEMLKLAIEQATDNVWVSGNPPLWQVGFHITNSVDFYFSTFNRELDTPNEQYTLPDNMKKHVNKGFFDNHPEEIVTKPELLDFLQSTKVRIRQYFKDNIVEQFADESGFHWLPMTKLELILYNIRHIMEHTAIINQILKAHSINAAGWKGIAEL